MRGISACVTRQQQQGLQFAGPRYLFCPLLLRVDNMLFARVSAECSTVNHRVGVFNAVQTEFILARLREPGSVVDGRGDRLSTSSVAGCILQNFDVRCRVAEEVRWTNACLRRITHVEKYERMLHSYVVFNLRATLCPVHVGYRRALLLPTVHWSARNSAA